MKKVNTAVQNSYPNLRCRKKKQAQHPYGALRRTVSQLSFGQGQCAREPQPPSHSVW